MQWKRHLAPLLPSGQADISAPSVAANPREHRHMTKPPAFTFRLGRFLGALAFVGLSAASACGGDADVAEDHGLCSGDECDPLEGTNPCKDVLKDKCGKSCSATSLCEPGLYCDGGKCTAQCLAGEANQCGSGNHCASDGHCAPGPDLNGGLGGEGGGGSCIDVDVDFTPQTPTVMVLVDRSGSMNAPDDTFENAPNWQCDASESEWRWNVARYVLMHPTEGVVKPLEGKVRFGLTHYSADDGGSSHPAGQGSGTCPELSGVVPPALNNYEDMLENFPCSDIVEDTPTGPALHAVASQLALFDEPGPKVIVLATDGEPDDCDCPDFDPTAFPGCDDERAAQVKDEVVAEAQSIHSQDDITIHTVLIANENDNDLWNHIQAVAQAGGGQAFGAYDVNALKDAFQNIVDGSRNCKIDLTGAIQEGEESKGIITLDGETLVLDGPDGWKVNNASQIELMGAACDAIKSGDHNLDIKFPCGTFDPDIR